MMMGRGFVYGLGPYGCGFLPMFLAFLLTGVVILLILKHSSKKSMAMEQSPKAMEILNERFARGELTQEEYEKMKKAIQEKV